MGLEALSRTWLPIAYGFWILEGEVGLFFWQILKLRLLLVLWRLGNHILGFHRECLLFCDLLEKATHEASAELFILETDSHFHLLFAKDVQVSLHFTPRVIPWLLGHGHAPASVATLRMPRFYWVSNWKPRLAVGEVPGSLHRRNIVVVVATWCEKSIDWCVDVARKKSLLTCMIILTASCFLHIINKLI